VHRHPGNFAAFEDLNPDVVFDSRLARSARQSQDGLR
jgi:hypothetical protein